MHCTSSTPIPSLNALSPACPAQPRPLVLDSPSARFALIQPSCHSIPAARRICAPPSPVSLFHRRLEENPPTRIRLLFITSIFSASLLSPLPVTSRAHHHALPGSKLLTPANRRRRGLAVSSSSRSFCFFPRRTAWAGPPPPACGPARKGPNSIVCTPTGARETHPPLFPPHGRPLLRGHARRPAQSFPRLHHPAKSHISGKSLAGLWWYR